MDYEKKINRLPFKVLLYYLCMFFVPDASTVTLLARYKIMTLRDMGTAYSWSMPIIATLAVAVFTILFYLLLCIKLSRYDGSEEQIDSCNKFVKK